MKPPPADPDAAAADGVTVPALAAMAGFESAVGMRGAEGGIIGAGAAAAASTCRLDWAERGVPSSNGARSLTLTPLSLSLAPPPLDDKLPLLLPPPAGRAEDCGLVGGGAGRALLVVGVPPLLSAAAAARVLRVVTPESTVGPPPRSRRAIVVWRRSPQDAGEPSSLALAAAGMICVGAAAVFSTHCRFASAVPPPPARLGRCASLSSDMSII